VSIEQVQTLIVGAGQAGLAMSEQLRLRGAPHLVLERRRIAERWRSERWDSLVANGPAWHDRFPTSTFPDLDPDSFAPRDRIVEYFEAHAQRIAAPVRCGVEVTRVHAKEDGEGFIAETSSGVIEARTIVAATGAFQRPTFPAMVPAEAAVHQMHSSAYRNPGQLPEGAVLVVGAGSSGVQIADELRSAGRRVFLSVGPHSRPPRRYRGRDFVWWLGALGLWDLTTPAPSTEHVTIAVSGAKGGHTVDFRHLAASGITLVGRTQTYNDGRIGFGGDLARNIAAGDADYLSLLDAADAYVAREGLDAPEEPEARLLGPEPASVTDPVGELDLAAEGVSSIVWATGYSLDFGWLDLPTFDERGAPRHQQGVSIVPGLYFLGLPWLARRASSFIWGVWKDADYLADRIAARRQ
jgi:putative flavoprotein involved in K+ transport